MLIGGIPASDGTFEMKEISTRRRICGECQRHFVNDIADAGVMLAPMLQNAIWKQLGYHKKDVICWDCVHSRAQQRLGRPLQDRDWQTCKATLRLGAYWHWPREDVPARLRPWFEAASLYFPVQPPELSQKETQQRCSACSMPSWRPMAGSLRSAGRLMLSVTRLASGSHRIRALPFLQCCIEPCLAHFMRTLLCFVGRSCRSRVMSYRPPAFCGARSRAPTKRPTAGAYVGRRLVDGMIFADC